MYGAAGIVVRSGTGNDQVTFDDSDGSFFGEDGDDFFVFKYGDAKDDHTILLDGGDGQDRFTMDGRFALLVDLEKASFTIGSGLTVTMTSVEDVYGKDRADIIKGSAADNVLSGGGGSDVLVGRGGDDRLIAGSNSGSGETGEVLTGGSGADLFEFSRVQTSSLDDSTDRITDFSSRQGDRIALYLDGTPDTREYRALAFIGSAAFTGQAGELRYEIVDGETRLLVNLDEDADAEYTLSLDGEHRIAFDDLVGVLPGPAIYGTAEGDLLDGTNRGDLILAGEGADTLDGGGGDDQLFGERGNDRLIGGRGIDVIDGGKGQDTIDLSSARSDLEITLAYNASSTVYENGVASDTLVAIEGIVGGSGDDRLSGGSKLFGGAGDDYLDGGYRVLNGGDGDDHLSGYNFFRENSVVKGGRGIDTIEVFSFGGIIDLEAGTATYSDTNVFRGVENVLLGPNGAQYATILGSDAANQIRGGAGNDVLDGRGATGGRDVISGEGGADRISFGLGAADLSGGAGNDVFLARADGTAAVTIDGGDGADVLSLTDAAGAGIVDLSADMFDVAGGPSGAVRGVEAVVGSRFSDTIVGDAASNVLEGGGKADTLTGAAGADRFVFRTIADSSENRVDRITDFSQSDLDTIDLHSFALRSGSAVHFTFVGTAAFSGTAAELHYRIDAGTTWVEGDADGDGVADIAFTLDGAITLTAADFVL